MAVTYKDIMPSWDNGVNNMGGTMQIGFFASYPDFLTFPKPGASPATPEDEYVVSTPPTFKTGKCFRKIYFEEDKSEFTMESLGTADGGGFKVTATGFVPSDDKDLNYLANIVRGSKYILVIPDSDGTMNQVGTEEFPATMKLSKATGTHSNGVKGYNVEVSAYMPKKILFTAAVPLTPAV